ncbi:MAG: hypothetical protein HY695_12435 [Deltaproteobacteria bacterium]|nr:hypothetical protein [Deltaproteobacteria bacterium]
MKRLLSIAAIGSLLAALVFVVQPVRAGDVDQRIQTLEGELARLKGEQMELKREATAAAAALPNISYRPGSGVLLEAADKSWSIRNHFRFHLHVAFEEGKDQNQRTKGEVAARRIRPTWYLCVNNCFYEAEVAIDLDGFQTGSGHSSGADTTNGSVMQRAVGYIHFENINPFLPTFYLGADSPADINSYSQASSNTSAQLDYDLLRRNNGFNTGRMGTGVGVRWEDLPLGPGRARINFAMGSEGEADDGLSVNTDRKDYVVFAQVEPFANIKNKWLSGFGFSMGTWFCNFDIRSSDNGCDELRIRDNGPFGRQDLFRADGPGVNRSSRGAVFVSPGIGYRVGPYQIRGIAGWIHYENSGTRGKNWMIFNELMVWSPKGFLTGSYTTPGTVYVGAGFERLDAKCRRDSGFCNNGTFDPDGGGPLPATDQFSRNRILMREFDIWYVIQRGMNMGVTFWWYDAANLRTGQGRSQEALLEKTSTTVGKGGDWLDIILAWRWQW